MSKPPFEIFRVSVPDGEYSRRADVVEKLHYDAIETELVETVDDLDTVTRHNIDLQLKNQELTSLLYVAKELLSTISMHTAIAPTNWCDSFKNEVSDRIKKIGAALASAADSGGEQ